MPERSKGRVQTKRDTQVPQVGGSAGAQQPHPVESNFVQKPHNQPQIIEAYVKHTKQRIGNNHIMMATWNVRTMLQPGRMQEVAKKMIRYRTDIMALQSK
jgi:hypothetical protein